MRLERSENFGEPLTHVVLHRCVAQDILQTAQHHRCAAEDENPSQKSDILFRVFSSFLFRLLIITGDLNRKRSRHQL